MLESIPDDFLWGAALHGHCVEGGYRESDWCHWEKRPGNIADTADSARGAEFWDQYKNDFRVARDFGLNALLITLEWSRIVPEEGTTNQKALNQYAKIIGSMREAGITPIIALYHVALPTWVADQGGWSNPATASHFDDYAKIVSSNLSEHEARWIPILEPAHYALRAYRLGHWPPNKKSTRTEHRVLAHLADAHTLAYESIKQENENAQVGVGLRVADFVPKNPYRAWDARAAIREGYNYKQSFIASLQDVNPDSPPFDFIGLSYFGQHTVAWKWRAPRKAFVQYVQTSSRTLECAPCPEAFNDALACFADHSLPVFIIGNGSVSNEDVDQCTYLLDHIDALTKVFNSGIDLRGYLYYGLLDGFEWERGYASKRGLFHVDAKRLTRTPKPVALIFKELIATGTVRLSTLNQFVPERTL